MAADSPSSPSKSQSATLPASSAPSEHTQHASSPSDVKGHLPLLPDEKEWEEAVRQDRTDLFLLPWLLRVDSLLLEGEVRGSGALVERCLCICGSQRSGQPSISSAWNQLQPGRSVRCLVARCLVCLYRHSEAEKPPLFEVMGALRDVYAADIPTDAHLAAMHVARELIMSHPHGVGSQFSAVPICLRIIRTSSHTVLVRYYALRLLESILAHDKLPASMLKDALKTLKQALHDKAGPVVRASAACLELVFRDATRSDIETQLASIVKVLASADRQTRTALARLAATLLIQTETMAPADEGKDPVVVPLYTAEQQMNLLHVHLSRAGSWKARVGVLQMYDALLALHGSAWLEQHLQEVFVHLVRDIATNMPIPAHESPYLCRAVHRVLDVHLRSLPEPAQERAAAYMGSNILGMWPPATPAHEAPSEAMLTLTLDATALLVAQLGELSPTLHEALYESHMRLLAHPILAVQMRAAWWLSIACDVQPLLLAPTYAELLTFMRRDMAALSTPQHDQGVSLRARLVGHSFALAALARISAKHPLYMRNDDVEDVFTLATDLLTRSGEQNALPNASAAVGSAWMLVGSLMTLGTEFVRAHLPTLMNAWRQALAERSYAELDDAAWQFLLTVRHGALSSMHVFFLHGGHELLTQETARRLVVMQSHVLAFLDAWERRAMFASHAPAALPILSRVHAPLLRVRILRCCTHLAQTSALETLAPHLMSMSVELLARAERWHTGSATQTAISTSTGASQSPWTVHDGVAYGMTSLLRQDVGAALDAWTPAFSTAPFQPTPVADSDTYGLDLELELDAQTPVLGALEHDATALYALAATSVDPYRILPGAPQPMPPGTAEIDAAAELFAALFAFQPRDLQIGTSEFLLAAQRRPALDKQPGRRIAVLVNSVVALLGAVRTAAHHPHRASGFANERVNAAIKGVAQRALQEGHVMLRRAAAELYGYLASLAGSGSLSMQMQFLIDQIVDTRHADGRAACALALGQIYTCVGGLRASPLTKTINSLTLSLATDPHPAVHACALDALAQVIEAAGVAYEPYVRSTLGLMTRLLSLPTHEPEGGSPGSSNLRVDWPAYPGIARVVSALVGVLGPDLQEAVSTRGVVYALLLHLVQDGGDAAAKEALLGLQRLGLVVPVLLETRVCANLLRHALSRPILAPSAASLYCQMAQRGSQWLARYGGPSLLAGLLQQLDRHPTLSGVRTLVLSWLKDTAPARPCTWMDLCCTVLLTPEALSFRHVNVSGSDTDETATALAPKDDTPLLSIRWRTQLFVLQCMDEVFASVQRAPEHVGSHSDARDRRVLSSRVSEILRAACSASTATHRAVRWQGLQVLRDVLESFADTRDPDFSEARLLEQFQAQLAAALTPAFGADSTPDVLAAAISVCSVYIIAGVDASPTNRILRLLGSALEQTQSSEMSRLGELPLTPNAAAYLNIAVLTAWARLAIAQRPAITNLLSPHVHTLARAWVHVLTAYAVLRADRGSSVASAWHIMPRMRPESALAPLVQTHMLLYFAQAYPTLLHALTLVFETNPDVVRATLAHDLGDASRAFLALYGLALETLCDELDRLPQTEQSMLGVVLSSLHVLVDAKYSGHFLLEDAQFDELMCVFQRALLSEDTSIQRGVLRVIATLVRSMRERLLEQEDGMIHDERMPTTKLGRLWRLLMHFIHELPHQRTPRAERAVLLHACWQTLLDMVEVCGASLQLELVAVSLHILVAFARREDEAASLLTSALPVLRDLCKRACQSASANPPLVHRIMQGFMSAMIDMSDALRARAGDIVTRRSGNALVSTSLVLTCLDARVSISSEVIERLSFLLAQKLDANDDAPVVLQCIRSMVHAEPSCHSQRLCIGWCLPSLVAYTLRHLSEPAMDILLDLVCVMPDDVALRLAVPVAVQFVQSSSPGRSQASDTVLVASSNKVVNRLMELAQTHAQAFRLATQALDEDARTCLHDSLRAAVGITDAQKRPKPGSSSGATSESGNSISLRTFGGSS